jgi:hypothetical protein
MDETLHRLLPSERNDRLDRAIGPEGPEEPLVVWQRDEDSPPVLVDGYRRYEICLRRKLPYRVVYRDFADLADAARWKVERQCARRNVTEFSFRVSAARAARVLFDQLQAVDAPDYGKITGALLRELIDATRNTETRFSKEDLEPAFLRLVPSIARNIRERHIAASDADIASLAGHSKMEQVEIVNAYRHGEFASITEAICGLGNDHQTANETKAIQSEAGLFDDCERLLRRLSRCVEALRTMKGRDDTADEVAVSFSTLAHGIQQWSDELR